jgi:hypothetical protein
VSRSRIWSWYSLQRHNIEGGGGIKGDGYKMKMKNQDKNNENKRRHYATGRIVTGTNPDEVIGFFN